MTHINKIPSPGVGGWAQWIAQGYRHRGFLGNAVSEGTLPIGTTLFEGPSGWVGKSK